MNAAVPTLLVATANAGKVEEFRRLLPLGVELRTLADEGVTLPPEVGTTFAQNAAAKALAAAGATGLLALADDSGLEVDALGGAPGIHSARYAGEPRSDARNREKLLQTMRDIPMSQRTARFRCAVAMARPGHIVATAEGTCEGAIAFAPAGDHGFGYDPIFLTPSGLTMAQLDPGEKDRISHRGRAFAAVLPDLLRELGQAEADGEAPS